MFNPRAVHTWAVITLTEAGGNAVTEENWSVKNRGGIIKFLSQMPFHELLV